MNQAVADHDVDEELESGPDDLWHAITCCHKHYTNDPPEGAWVEAACGRLVKTRYNGPICPECHPLLGFGPRRIRCWKCGE